MAQKPEFLQVCTHLLLEPKALSNQMLKRQVLASPCPRPATSLGKVWESAWPHADYMLCILCLHAACYVNRIKSKLLHMDGGLFSVWPLPTCLALGHGVPPFLPMSHTRLWPGGLPLHTSSQSPWFHVFVLLLGPDIPPTSMFFLFLFTWLILAHIFDMKLC